MIQVDGVTEIDLEQAVRIVDQDSTSVTVRLNQAWTSSQETIDHIFYSWDESVWDTKCEEVTDVRGGEVFTPPEEDITIHCLEHASVARMEICLAHICDVILDSVLDNATIPKCCHPDIDPSFPVVCYHIAIHCESQCVESTERRGLRGSGDFEQRFL